MIHKLIALLPPGLIRAIGRLQFQVPVLGPLIRRAARRIASREGVIKYGVGAGLRFDATGGFAGYLLGTSEPDEQEALARFLRSGDTFFDIGANIGFFSTLAAHLVGPTGRVYAFEPFPSSAAAAQRNALLNGFDHLHVVNAAVSRSAGRRWLRTMTSPDQSKLVQERPDAGIEVNTVGIDEFIAEQGTPVPDVVMIDVEGEEIDVLRGMQRTIAEHTPVIMCEVHWLGQAFTDFVARQLRPLGYRVTTLQGAELPQGTVRYHLLAVAERRRE